MMPIRRWLLLVLALLLPLQVAVASSGTPGEPDAGGEAARCTQARLAALSSSTTPMAVCMDAGGHCRGAPCVTVLCAHGGGGALAMPCAEIAFDGAVAAAPSGGGSRFLSVVPHAPLRPPIAAFSPSPA